MQELHSCRQVPYSVPLCFCGVLGVDADYTGSECDVGGGFASIAVERAVTSSPALAHVADDTVNGIGGCESAGSFTAVRGGRKRERAKY